MSTYKTGTVSVTNGSAVVTGSGTAWSVALVAGGMFSSAGIAVPIASVGSDTSITLDYPWPGTTASGAAYSIALENSSAASVVGMNSIVSRLLVTLSLAGITPNSSGSLTDRAALTLTMADKGYLFLRAEIGVAFAFYRWTGTSWDGPFAVQGPAGVGTGGYGLPTGGTTGQFLRKASGTDGDSAWATPAASAISNDSGVSGATTKDALDSLSSSIALAAANVAKRGTVRAATTANVTISTALNNADVIDGVTLATGDLVLVKSQTAPEQNGVYLVGVTPVRSSEYDTYNEHPGALLVVQEGTTLADTFWYCTSNVGGTLGTTAIAFSQLTVTLSDGSVTNAKLANMANATIKGRATAGTGAPEDLSLTQVLDMVGSAAQGDILYRGSSTWSRLAKGTALQVLRQNTALTAPEWASAREVLTANRTYYVRTTGSDSNDGLTAGTAFLTVQKAINVAIALDMSIYAVTVDVGSGTFSEGIYLNISGNGNARITLLGAGYTSTVISGSTYGLLATGGLSLTVKDLKATGGTVAIWSRYGAQVFLIGNVALGGGSARLIGVDNGGYLECAGSGNNIYLDANSAYAFYAAAFGHIFIGSSAGVLTTAARTFTATVNALNGGIIELPSVTFTTTAGAITGSRYAASNLGIINTTGAGTSYIPGSTAGTGTNPSASPYGLYI
ncbi:MULTISPECIES: hypothetical protein [unclassified Mesorhizobium]|uniref:hypothetical protein n=1 Tax=unclassified Mesorhizobium TaxID=325217 RepID=UPI001FE1DCC4|nr:MULTISPECIES: hypothetical protein [unclassified Mesorhizobium]